MQINHELGGHGRGVGISSTSDSYSVIPSELLGDTNKVVVVAHYVVHNTTMTVCTGVVCTYCQLTQDAQVRV